MRIDVTVGYSDCERDVRLEAPDDAALSAVLRTLADVVGAPPDTPVWLGTDLLGADTSLTDSRLRTGVRLCFGGADRIVGRQPVLALHVAGGPAAGRSLPLERGRLTVGRATDNDLVLPDPDVSRRHAIVAVTGTDITVHDVGSANGTFLGGRRLPPEGETVRTGDVIRLGASLLAIAGPTRPPASLRSAPDGGLLLDRAPRTRELVEQRVIIVPSSAAPARPRSVQWVTALLPAAAGVAIALLLGQPEFLLFALLSPAMLISSSLGDRLQWRRSCRRSAAALRRQRAEFDREIADALRAEAAMRRRAAPDPADVRRAVSLPDTHVWARQREDADLLQVRVGVAELPSALTVRDGASVTRAGTIADVPLCVDLRCGPIGLAGPAGIVRASARWLVGQLAAHGTPADIEFLLLLGTDQEDCWRWMRWLPHLRDKPAVDEAECRRLLDTIAIVVEERAAQRRSAEVTWRGPWLVVVVDRPALTGLAGLAEMLDRGSGVGVTAVWLAPTQTALPACCTSTARAAGASQMVVCGPSGKEIVALADQVSDRWADDVGRYLAPLLDAGAADEARVPDRCRLLDLLGRRHPGSASVCDRWDGSGGGARAVIGHGASGVVALDLANDGPHALIAGTTGAGKSELLRTMVAGLAVDHPPDELNVLLIDYKGGAAFAECAQLPHVAGLVTDLDPYLTERALRSLRAELHRRERLFAAAGADDLNAYRAQRCDPLVPRLVIVVDEFATLAEELPDFVSGLVNVARLGRSLGLHLVLATQRPGGVVSPEIRANTDLRIALRVSDPSESRDVIGSPLAASVDRKLPGRGHVRTGATLTCFQTAYVSGHGPGEEHSATVHPLDRWRRAPHGAAESDESDLVRLVAAVRAAARERGSAPARSPWPPPLPERLTRAELPLPARRSAVALGLLDLPGEQRQDSVEFDLDPPASLLIAGGPRSGRTTSLINLALGAAAACSPAELHIQVIDAGGDLARAVRPLPHCATVLGPAEVDLAPTLLTRLALVAAERLASGTPTSDSAASVLVLIDGWDLTCAALDDVEAASGTDTLMTLLRVAPGAGMAIALTGDRSVLAPRFSGGFAERLLLRLADRHDAAAIGVRPRDVPRLLPAGRAVRASDGAVVQLALAAASADTLHSDIAATALRWMPTVPDPTAIRVRPLPDRVRLDELPAMPGRLALGLAGDDPAPVFADPFAGPARWLVAGPPRSGRTTLLRLLATQAHAAGIATLVAATERSALLATARDRGIPTVGPAGVVGPTPTRPTLVLVDDSEAFTDTAIGSLLADWARNGELALALVAAGRADDLATTYRGVAAEVRRHRFGVLLRPGPLDGELFGLRLPRHGNAGPPGRGVALGDPSWGRAFADGRPVPIQVATP